MTPRIKEAIEIFIHAVNTKTLAKGTCVACAVGNLVAHGLGEKIFKEEGEYLTFSRINYKWKNLFCTMGGYQVIQKDELGSKLVIKNIEATKFTWQELAKIEFAFETNTKIDFSNYCDHTEQEIIDDQIKGLTAVIEVMLGFDDVKIDIKKQFLEKIK